MSEIINKTSCQVCPYKSMLFQKIPEDQLNEVNQCKKQFRFKKGESIYKEGDKIEHLIYLHTGLIKLFRQSGEGNQIISIAKPYDFVGLLSVFSNQSYLYSMTAIEDSELCFIHIDCMKKEIKQNGDFAMGIIEKMSSMTDNLLNYKYSLSKKNLRGRIAQILIDFADNIYKTNEFKLPVSRREIGELIDMRTENVIRIFSEFRRDGLIKINGPTIEITNIDLLRMINEHG